MPNLLSRTPMEVPRKAAEVYAVLEGKDYRVSIEKILSLLTPEMLGLGNVDNTRDIDKEVSTKVREALERKAAKSDLENLVTQAQVTESIKEAIRTLKAELGGTAGEPGQAGEEKINELINNFWNTQIAEGGVIKVLQTDNAETKSGLAALNETVQGHTGKLTQSEEDITTLKNKVAGIEQSLQVPGNPDQSAGVTANTAAIAALGERVSAVEGKVNAVDTKAEQQTVTELTERVQTVETTANAAATAQSVQELTQRVEGTEGVANAAATKVEHEALVQRVQTLENAEAPANAATKEELQTVQGDVQALKTKTEGLDSWNTFKQEYDRHIEGMSMYVQESALAEKMEQNLANVQTFSDLSGKVTELEATKETVTQLQQTLQQLQQKVLELEAKVTPGGVPGG